MPNPGKFRRSVQLLKLTFGIFRENKRLLLFPALNAIFIGLILVVFFAPDLLRPTGFTWQQWGYWDAIGQRYVDMLQPWKAARSAAFAWTAYGRIAALYLSVMFCSTFTNVAFYHEIIEALAGDGVCVRRGLACACRRGRSILAWTLFGGTIGIVIQLLSERFGFVGRFALRLVGFTWSVAAAFIIPVIIRDESSNPVALLRNSAATVRKTWGELLIGYAGLQLGPLVVPIFMLLFFVPEIFLMPYLMGNDQPNAHFLFVCAAIWALVLLALMSVVSLAGSTFRCALYIYASEGVVPQPYDSAMMDAAWKVKKL